MEVLVKHHAKVDCLDKDAQTPLHVSNQCLLHPVLILVAVLMTEYVSVCVPSISICYAPPFEDKRAYCFAHVGWSVLSVRLEPFRFLSITREHLDLPSSNLPSSTHPSWVADEPYRFLGHWFKGQGHWVKICQNISEQ